MAVLVCHFSLAQFRLQYRTSLNPFFILNSNHIEIGPVDKTCETINPHYDLTSAKLSHIYISPHIKIVKLTQLSIFCSLWSSWLDYFLRAANIKTKCSGSKKQFFSINICIFIIKNNFFWVSVIWQFWHSFWFENIMSSKNENQMFKVQ